MYTKNRRKTHPENIEITTGEKDTGEEDDEEKKRHYQKRHNKTSKSTQNKLANEPSTKNNGASSLSNLSCKIFVK